MKTFLKLAVLVAIPLALVVFVFANRFQEKQISPNQPKTPMADKIIKSNAEWESQLTDQQFYVTRQKGTERAFTGTYWDNKEDGQYRCVCCGLPLFDSSTKFKSGTGWPSFYAPLNDNNVAEKTDSSLFSVRTEVLCNRCDAHLGHVFVDGPEPTGLRYCLNSAALKFETRVEAGSDMTPKQQSGQK